MGDLLPTGLYEELLTSQLEGRLAKLVSGRNSGITPLSRAEAADRLALHVASIVEAAVAALPAEDRASRGTELVRTIAERLSELGHHSRLAADLPIVPGRVLRAIHARNPDGSAAVIEAPLIPLLDTALLSNARGEPALVRQLQSEMPSADRIDVIVAFIRYSGIRPHLDALRRHTDAGRPLRVLTTTYTASTEPRALDALVDLGAEVRVSYDTSSTRLHAKAWLFHRLSGTSTAYIGSSNLTHTAQAPGLEWNVRISGRRNPDTWAKMAASFDGAWENGDFVPYDPAAFAAAIGAIREPAADLLSPIELRLEPFQERLLDQLAAARERGRHRNLLVAATGTGKTVMAAVDYARLRGRLPRARLLFVAHREEILDQSLRTFRHALREPAFGEKWVGGVRPERWDHVFASIQSIAASGPDDIAPEHFDVAVIDEFHHAAAPSYAALLEHLAPRELLGLTATPERADGMPILHWFDDRMAAELRLWDAIDQQRLAPFHYYGIHDGLDLRHVPWRRGLGYDVQALDNVITGNHVWARTVIAQVVDHVADPRTMRALGFCVSVRHAHFMAEQFRAAGIAAVAVSGGTSDADRAAALADLRTGAVNAVFSVDLFNEGVDVPQVDTLILLRPTQSATVFLQQLGRGLRKAHGKSVCTVLDFVGQHRTEFRFDLRLRALLGGSRKHVEDQVRQDFPYLPAGCHMHLDPVAREIVLASLRTAIPTRWRAMVAELRGMSGDGSKVRLADYLRETGLGLADVCDAKRSWSDLCEAAGVPVAAAGPHEAALRRAVGRLLHLDDEHRLATYDRFLANPAPPDPIDPGERALLRMLVIGLGRQVIGKRDLAAAADLVWRHPQVLAELREVVAVLRDGIDRVSAPLPDRPDVPLRVHASYTREEILAALHQAADRAATPPWREGVMWLPDQRADVFVVTLDKSPDHFSPTTRYRDYAISPTLFHWESQSTTGADSVTGRRYRAHAAYGSQVYLFVRRSNAERAFWFLGPATYVRHEGERPMAITWRLAIALPGDLYADFAAVAVA